MLIKVILCFVVALAWDARSKQSQADELRIAELKAQQEEV